MSNLDYEAQVQVARAKSSMLRMAGAGALLTGIGGAALLGSYAYASFADQKKTGAAIAQGLVETLVKSDIQLPLDPNAKVRVADSQIRLAPNSTVAVTGRVAVDATELKLPEGAPLPRPTAEQLRNDAPREQQVKVSYTVFKEVPWGGGKVVTGYKFDPNAPSTPRVQHCYYETFVEKGSSVTVYMAQDGVFDYDAKAPSGMDAVAAARNCIWFDGRPTRF